jgi:hypothetical protein
MPSRRFSATVRARILAGAPLLACTLLPAQVAPHAISLGRAPQIITLDHGGAPQSASYVPAKGEFSFANAPRSFYAFSPARVDETAPLEAVTLRFSAPTTITRIESTSADFVVEYGGSCAAGNSYGKGDSCIVLMRFTPQGPGRRLGRLNVSHSASAEPADFGLGGNGYSPAISFVPSRTYTLAGTYSGSAGVLNSAHYLTVDASDSLYIADTGNAAIRYMNSGGTLDTLLTGLTDIEGLASDSFGDLYFDQPSENTVTELYNFANTDQLSGTGSASGCTASAPCDFFNVEPSNPQAMSMDSNNDLFFANGYNGAAMSEVNDATATFINLDVPFLYEDENLPDAFTTNVNDQLFSMWDYAGVCEIVEMDLYDAENDVQTYTKVAGGRTCGYSGDGGQAGNAQLSTDAGQIAFDAAGDLYFTDMDNQRVRMINVNTGIISTVVGTGTQGFTDAAGNRSNTVNLSNPTGLAVDSQGQIYVITEAPSGGATQAVQQVSATGYLVFASQTEGTTSAALLVTVTNVGNSDMTLTNYAFTGADPGDYAIDPTTTSCVLTPGANLYAGESCQIGIKFTPKATGTRTANLVLLDNTVTNSNTIALTGSSTAPAPSFVPGAVAFPATAPAGSSTIPVTLTNTGNIALDVSNITLGGTNAGAFSFTSNCAGGSIAPNASCTLNVTFKPSSTGNYSAALNFTDNAPNSPQSVFVSGSGAKPYTSATKLASATNPSAACAAVTFHVTVSTSDGTSATGPVALQMGGLTLASGILSDGAATLTVQGLAPGLNLLTASYGGDTEHAGSASAVLSQMVERGSCGRLNPLVPVSNEPVHAPLPERP